MDVIAVLMKEDPVYLPAPFKVQEALELKV